MYKLAVITSHPIQYQAPLFRKIASSGEIDLKVFFRFRKGVDVPVYDKEFGRELKWDVPLLDGYQSVFAERIMDVLREIKNFAPQALMVYGWGTVFNKIVLYLAIGNKIPVFMCSETSFVQEQLKNKIILAFKNFWLRSLFRKIRAFLYIGEENKKFYESLNVPKEKLFFAPYAVENDRFMKTASELKIKRYELGSNLNIKSKDTVILFVGKLIEKKRPFDLLKAYEFLVANNKLQNLHLIFVGDGKLRSELETYAKNKFLSRVHFAGFKNQTEVPFYYALADIFVLPSGRGETWGLVVNEAMCFGLPIIVSDEVGCGPDLVRSGENGYLFAKGAINELADKIEKLLNDKRREIFGRRSYEIIKQYTYDQNLKAILGVFAYINKP